MKTTWSLRSQMLPLPHAYSTTFKLLIYFNTVRIRFLSYLNQWNKMIIILALCQFNVRFVFKWCHNRVGYYATFSFSQSVFCEKQTNKQTKTEGKQQQRKESGILESYVRCLILTGMLNIGTWQPKIALAWHLGILESPIWWMFELETPMM